MRVGFAVVVLLVVMLPCVHALGLSYEYLENKTLPLAPGQNYYFKLTLQNEQSEDVELNVSLSSDIATLVGDQILTIPTKTYDRFVYFNISVPRNSPVGEHHILHYTVSPVGRGEGQVPFSVRYDRTLDVVVSGSAAALPIEMPADINAAARAAPLRFPFLLTMIIGGALLVLLCVLLWRRSDALSKRVRRLMKPKKQVIHAIASPEHYFYTHDGLRLKGLHDLLNTLRTMDDAAFSKHVNMHKNDFSLWVDESLAEHEIAAKLAAKRTRAAMIKVLEHELR